jgi:uncharacterized protein YbjT (DUF2867 family)
VNSLPVRVTGGTGYVGRPLIEALLARGYAVHALVRPGSGAALAEEAVPVAGDALDAATFATAIPPQSTIVHLVGRRIRTRPRRLSFSGSISARSARPRWRRSVRARCISCTSAWRIRHL